MIQAFGLTSNPRKAHPPAVDDVSFEARAGHVTALLGGTGAGKTTALRLMLELQPGRGITYFRGRPLHRIAHPAREIGVLLGDVPGHPARSVRGHLRMLCAASGVPARRADEVLEVIGLVSLREERLGTLSRSMDRRLGLACALLSDPHTLVLDAPTEGLSGREAQWLHGMLRAHADQGGTVLFTTARPKEAARTADRVVTLDSGRLVADQDAREFARTRLRPRVAVRSPHAGRLATLLTKEARTARRSVEVVREGGNRLSVYGSTTADVGETAFRHGILVHQLADEIGDMGPGGESGPDGAPSAGAATAAADEPPAERRKATHDLPTEAPEGIVRALPAVEASSPGYGLAASASGASSLALSAAESDASACGPSKPKQPAVVTGRASGKPGTTTQENSAGERRATPFGFTAEVRDTRAASTSAPRRSVAAGSSGEAPRARERAQVPGADQAAPTKASGTPPGADRTEAAHRVRADGAATVEQTRGTSGTARGGRGVTDADVPGGGVQAVAAEKLAGADGSRTADATDTSKTRRDVASTGTSGAGRDAVTADTDAGHDRVAAGASKAGRGSVPAGTPDDRDHSGSAAKKTRTTGPSTFAAGIAARCPRLPGARNPGTRRAQAMGDVRPDGVTATDALSPLPPPISVRPAPSPLRPLRYEIRRATGIGTGFLTCGAVLVVSVLTAVLLARIGHTPQARLFAAWPRELPLPPAALAAGLLGALAFGDEFRHPALAADRGTVPRRLGLLTAKLLVSGATAVMLAFVTIGCDAEALYVVYGRELAQVPADWLPLTAGWFGLVVGCAWAGVLAAGVFRSTAGGLAAVLAVPVVVVPLVQRAMPGRALRMADGLPVRMREVLLLQWPFGGERYLLGLARVLAQPLGGALALSLSALLCAYAFTSLRTRLR